ncbi:MAG: hypothetical protein ACI9U2_004355 [Bradymonadia bacterium]
MSKSPLDIGGVSSFSDVEFVERLGVGLGSGRFKARLTETNSDVSLLLVEGEKYDKPALLEWARRLKRVDHPGIPGVVRIEDVLEPGFVAQRYIEAHSLADRVASTGPLTSVDALAMGLQAAAALRATHRQEIPHGALATRSIRLANRDGAMDAVRIVGWRPLGPGRTHERGIANDVRALGEFIYFALLGTDAPTAPRVGPAEPGAPIAVSFSDLADGASRATVQQRAILDALARAGSVYAVDDVVDALLPEFTRFIQEAKAHVAYELGADREFKEEVQRQRTRQRELESKLRFIKDWLRDNAGDVDRVDEKVGELEKQERTLRNLEVELAMLLDRPIRPGQTLATARRPTAPAPMAPAPTPIVASAPPAAVAAPTRDDRPSIPMDPNPPQTGGSGTGKMLAIAVLAAGLAAGGMWFAMRSGSAGTTPASVPSVASAAGASAASATAGSTLSAAPKAGVQTVPTTAAPKIVPPRPASVASAPKPPPLAPDGMIYIVKGKTHPALSGEARTIALAQCNADTVKFPRTQKLVCGADAFPIESGDPVEVASFFIDRLEISQDAYSACVKRRSCKPLKLTWELEEQPATGVTWDMASAYCEFRGGRLPSADEWLRAARGDDERLYPWGSEPPVVGDKHKANYGRLDRKGPRPSRADGHKYAAPVGVFDDRGQSAFHVANLAGNVREWTATKTGEGAVVAGGGWRDMAVDLRTTRREVTNLDQVSNDLGFRCVSDAPR